MLFWVSLISYFRISIFVNLESLIISAFQGNSGKWMQLPQICKYILQRLVVSNITSNSEHFPVIVVVAFAVTVVVIVAVDFCQCCVVFVVRCCHCYRCYLGRCYRKCSRFSKKWSPCWHRNFPPQWTFALYVHSEVNLRKMGWKWKYKSKSENQNMKVTVQIFSSFPCPFFSSSLGGRISFFKYFPSFPFPFPWPNYLELRFHWFI